MAKGVCMDVAAPPPAQQPPVYIVLGHGGAMISGLADPPPPFVRASSREHGFIRADISATTLVVEAVRSRDGAVIDVMKLVKPTAPSRPRP